VHPPLQAEAVFDCTIGALVLFPLRAMTSAISPFVLRENWSEIVVPVALVLAVNHQAHWVQLLESAQLLLFWKLFVANSVVAGVPAIVKVGVLLFDAKAVTTYVVPEVMLNALVVRVLEPVVPDATLVAVRLTLFVSEKFTVPVPVALPTTL
jgi:hypothetical protein